MRVTPTVVFVSGCLLVITTASSAQSLADVARKEEERRKTQPAATKVYTNKDLGEAPPATMPPPAPASSSASEGSKGSSSNSADKATKDDKDAKGDAGKPQGQAQWADRMKTARETLDRDSTFVDALQSRVNALTTDFVNRDDPAQRATIEADRQKAMSELSRMKQKLVEDRKAIADIEEDARRAGVPPGWVR